MPDAVKIYDTTLRDGCQGAGISLSLAGQARHRRRLDALRRRLRRRRLAGLEPEGHAVLRRAARRAAAPGARLSAFGSTRRAGIARRGRREPARSCSRPRRRRSRSSRKAWRLPRRGGAPHDASRRTSRWCADSVALPEGARAARSSSTPSTSSTATAPTATTRSRCSTRRPTPGPTGSSSATRTAARCRSRSATRSHDVVATFGVAVGIHAHNDCGSPSRTRSPRSRPAHGRCRGRSTATASASATPTSAPSIPNLVLKLGVDVPRRRAARRS